MDREPITIVKLLLESHIGLQRQGPGSAETMHKALSFLENPRAVSRALDLGCGTGGQTLELAQQIAGEIIGVDQFSEFIEVFNRNAREKNLYPRVTGMVGSMEKLPFQPGEFDLIWSEGAIDNIGFARGLSYWNRFLREGGYVAVTSPCWFTDEHPAEVEQFWAQAGSRLDTIPENLAALQRAGYIPVATFLLPESCWTQQYFAPRQAAQQALLQKYGDDPTMQAFMEGNQYEVSLYETYKRHYGYAFYIGRKYRTV